MPTTRTYRATETGRHICDACTSPIEAGQRYSITVNGRNQVHVEHLDSGCDVGFLDTPLAGPGSETALDEWLRRD